VPVAVARGVLKLSTQGYYKWLRDPVFQREGDDAHAIKVLNEIQEDDPTLGYRFLTGELADAGISASENRVWRLCSLAGSSPPITAAGARPTSPGHRSTTTCSRASTI